jgi:hypothetical protein
LIETGIEIEYFHASEDKQVVRDKVFGIIKKHFVHSKIDSLVVEKSKTHPNLRHELTFYPKMLDYLLKSVLSKYNLHDYSKVIIFTDTIPVKNKRNAVEKAVKQALAKILPKGIKYSILHHSSKSNIDLQLADYCNWAIFRKWQSADSRSYDLIKKYIRSEFNIFEKEDTHYY